jgi:hypothetical protein
MHPDTFQMIHDDWFREGWRRGLLAGFFFGMIAGGLATTFFALVVFS